MFDSYQKYGGISGSKTKTSLTARFFCLIKAQNINALINAKISH